MKSRAVKGDRMPNPPYQPGQDLMPKEVAQWLDQRTRQLSKS